MTPLAASVPYSALADGPPATCTVSKSFGLMSLIRDGVCPPTPTEIELGPFSTRTPSTYTTGSFESDRLFEPRIRMRVPVPVVPPASWTIKPGARALSRFDMSSTGALLVMSPASNL